MHGQIELILDAKAQLGEGPTWDEANQRLLWVDILGKRLHVLDPNTNCNESIDIGRTIGAVVPRAKGGVILALENGFTAYDLQTKKIDWTVDPEGDKPQNRFNDGKCDAAGRFWAGTMGFDAEANAGSLYCLGTDLAVRKVVHPVTISNGMTWSPDNQTMYYIDSPTGRVVAYDFDLQSGNISNKRTVVEIPVGEGEPDGMTSDEEGMLWVAQWDGYQVSRWNPATGERIASISLPVARPSSCCFGGPDLNELYITSARTGLDEDQLTAQPLAGGLFRVKTDVRGTKTHQFAG